MQSATSPALHDPSQVLLPGTHHTVALFPAGISLSVALDPVYSVTHHPGFFTRICFVRSGQFWLSYSGTIGGRSEPIFSSTNCLN